LGRVEEGRIVVLGTGGVAATVAVTIVLVVATVGVTLGVAATALLGRTRRRAAEHRWVDRSTHEVELEAKAHLLEYRAEVLLGHVRDLEARRAELEQGVVNASDVAMIDPHALLRGLGMRSAKPEQRAEGF
jgi:hypothetical protein